MRFATGFLLLASMLSFASHTLALSIRIDARDGVARAVVEAPAVESAAKREVVAFTRPDTEVMAPHDVELVRRVGWTYRNNQTLLLAVIAKNAYVINATCASGNVITCAVGVTYSLFTFFFAAWKWSDRALSDAAEAPFFAVGPTPSKTLRQVVTSELAAGQWHYLGHVAHEGVNHTVHYYGHGDGFHQLRATTVPFWNETTLERRQDESNDGGFVGDYYWNSDNEGPYDSFHSTSDGSSYFAANAAGYMVNSQQAVSACTGFTDAQGPLDDGIITYSWPGSPYQWYDGEMASVFNGCAGELGDGPQ
ncbi:hypothetical protein PsYK624_066260 [Phanerochaete sordida]|uniref:Uncharacterized protein n=1 Tax=Phanerochaete sordida TaxID=48140 RepID=A0A9P3G8Y7_9APHY|nr:hypothetical protein PsYK624_066260 [Phanerochaete sordida]